MILSEIANSRSKYGCDKLEKAPKNGRLFPKEKQPWTMPVNLSSDLCRIPL